jgi:Na+-translocating ferredoxin:NAD+ oxidoreductase subunit C
MRVSFPAGLVLEPRKRQATGAPLRTVPEPAVAVLALDQGSGYAAAPVVAVGDAVAIGTVIARPAVAYASTLHAPVSGRVRSIERREAATASGWDLCVVIDNDGAAHRDVNLRVPTAEALADPQALLNGLLEAGIAGLGGAAFPTATKLLAARERQVRRLILNGAECEPWICCDDALMREQADDLVFGAQVLLQALQAETGCVAIEDDKPEAIASVRAAIARAGQPTLELVVVPAVYPAGAERQLVTAVTGIEVPTRELPVAAGVICQNVATAAAVARWVRTGEPCISRVVTVTGSAVQDPCNLVVRIGTPLHEVVAAAGGYAGTPQHLVAGGSMTGRALATDAIGLTKGMNCLLAASIDDVANRARAREVPCIRCGDCATVCPAGLLPQQLHRAALASDHAMLEQLGLVDCIECGCCDYVCPSQIPLAQRFRVARSELRVREDAARRAVLARERSERHDQRLRAVAEAEQRAFDAARRQARDAPTGVDPDARDP